MNSDWMVEYLNGINPDWVPVPGENVESLQQKRLQQRQSREQLRVMNSKKITKSAWQHLVEWMGSVANSAACLMTPTYKHSMCKYYGHVTPSTWEGMLPKCCDCGEVIKHSKDLRRSDPRFVPQAR